MTSATTAHGLSRLPSRSAAQDTWPAGDDLLPDAREEVTHQIGIDAPPSEVWPWLVQMGRGRGGWYSWDWLDNGGAPSADRIVPELQDLAVGDVLPIKPNSPDGFAVLVLDPPRALVLGDPSLLPGRPKPIGAPRATWAFSLQPIGDAATRLVVRVRVAYEPGLEASLLRPLVAGVHEVMERKQLRTLAARVEARRRRSSPDGAEGAPSSPSPLRRARRAVEALVGAGDRILALTLPFAVVGLAANLLYPSVFHLGLGAAGRIAGLVLAAIGVPLWLTSVVQILLFVPRGKLITRGPFALVRHPVYTSVALLVIPGCGLLFDSWLGFALGAVLYASARLFAPREERDLAARFPEEYPAYRRRVLLPWL